MIIFVTYASIQVTQAADATASFDVYDSDNYPQVSSPVLPLPLSPTKPLSVAGTLWSIQGLPKPMPTSVDFFLFSLVLDVAVQAKHND